MFLVNYMERLDSNQQKPSKQMFLISFSFIPADAGKGRAGNHLKAGWMDGGYSGTKQTLGTNRLDGW
jgi:hypothetical protein